MAEYAGAPAPWPASLVAPKQQKRQFCNRGRAREDFARVIPVEVLFRASDKDVGGTLARQDAGDFDHDCHPYNDSDGGRASEEVDLPSIPGI